MSVLIICEKPSVAKTVALALGAAEQKDGYLSGDGLLVSWCIGHLISMADAGSYDERYKKWRYEDLPILPQTWKYAPTPGKGKQLAVLKELLHRSDVSEVVNGCDAG
jgi:DNA topoisomerase